MSACGDRYADLVVTAGEGYTPENPYGSFAIPHDYAEWRELAERLGLRARSHLDRLQAIEKTDQEQVDRANALVQRYNALVDQVEGLPGMLRAWLSGTELITAITRAVAISVEATCIMESIDDEMATYGVDPPKEPGGRSAKTKKFELPDLANVAIVGGGIYLIWKVWKAEKTS